MLVLFGGKVFPSAGRLAIFLFFCNTVAKKFNLQHVKVEDLFLCSLLHGAPLEITLSENLNDLRHRKFMKTEIETKSTWKFLRSQFKEILDSSNYDDRTSGHKIGEEKKIIHNCGAVFERNIQMLVACLARKLCAENLTSEHKSVRFCGEILSAYNLNSNQAPYWLQKMHCGN